MSIYGNVWWLVRVRGSGDVVGLAVGILVGVAVGLTVGTAVGVIVGISVGLELGLDVVGLAVGMLVGVAVGLTVGLKVWKGKRTSVCAPHATKQEGIQGKEQPTRAGKEGKPSWRKTRQDEMAEAKQ